MSNPPKWMSCPKCKSDTKLVYGRQLTTEPPIFERRLRCVGEECRHSFTTHEGTANLVKRRVNPKPRKRKSPAEIQAQAEARKVYRLRNLARTEARETGRPLREILAAWNVPPTPFQANRANP